MLKKLWMVSPLSPNDDAARLVGDMTLVVGMCCSSSCRAWLFPVPARPRMHMPDVGGVNLWDDPTSMGSGGVGIVGSRTVSLKDIMGGSAGGSSSRKVHLMSRSEGESKDAVTESVLTQTSLPPFDCIYNQRS